MLTTNQTGKPIPLFHATTTGVSIETRAIDRKETIVILLVCTVGWRHEG